MKSESAMMRLSVRLLASALAVALAASPAAAQDRRGPEETERISRKFTIGGNGRFTLANISGNVTVSSGSGDEVAIEAVKRTRGERRELASVVVEFDERPGRLEVRTRHNARRDRASVDFTITVPRGATVDLSSISGNVRVSSLLGALRAQSVSGTVVVSDSSNVEVAKSMSGNVELTGSAADGRLTASTISGTVRARDLKARALSVSSVSGNAEVTNVDAERLEAKSVSGHVIFDGGPARNGRYEFSTHSGDVRLTLAASPGFELRASTFSGSIRSDLPVKVGGSQSRGRGRSITAVVGDGSASLSASTFSGTVVIRRR
jgi:DUF4097 and DUF4098 domain-containing protein YvlB